LLSAGNGSVQVWDLATGIDRVLIEDIGEGHMLLLSPDARVLTTSFSFEGHGSFTCLWNLVTGQKRTVLEDTRALAFSPDGMTLVTSGMQGNVVLWDVPTLVGSRPGE
jgi:WD40 repeat protein